MEERHSFGFAIAKPADRRHSQRELYLTATICGDGPSKTALVYAKRPLILFGPN
jgi:hypothetical protein